ncbi:ankyrin repeat and SOCS box protein 12-like, partial [Oppia nitens]|uniref:ankyrin repeat and SOCS box protein 12-like n=1 Tax=Oppia nitens TaxID=1686743 RepID=UPI0023DB8564
MRKSSPLSLAVSHGLIDCVRLLLNAGSDPNRLSTDSIGRNETPLCSVVRLGKLDLLNILLDCPDIDVNVTDFFGQTPVWLAVRERRPYFVDQLIRHQSFSMNCQSFLKRDTNPLYLSAKYINQGRVDCFKTLLNIGFVVDEDVLRLASKCNDQTVQVMVKNCSNINCQLTGHRVAVVVPTLKQLCRSKIRDIYLTITSSKPINFDNLQ